MSAPAKPDLSSWKEIASHLGVSIRTAQMWERERGLPVRRLPGKRGGRWAIAAELDEWRLGSPQNAEEELPQATRPRTVGWKIGGAIAALSLVIVGVGSPWSAPNPFRVDVRSTGFRVLDEGEHVLWERTWEEPLMETMYQPGEQRGLAQVADLDGDGRNEVLFVPWTSDSGERPLICFDGRGRELWRFHPGRPMKNDGGGTLRQAVRGLERARAAAC